MTLKHIILLVLTLTHLGESAKSTLDADGGADYTTWDDLIAAIKANTINPDTILI